MIGVNQLKAMIRKQWMAEFAGKPCVLPPEAKFITGRPKNDFHLHYLETVAGIQVKLSDDFKSMEGFYILDQAKFMWFTMRWS
jgi:hypothetical protein